MSVGSEFHRSDAATGKCATSVSFFETAYYIYARAYAESAQHQQIVSLQTSINFSPECHMLVEPVDKQTTIRTWHWQRAHDKCLQIQLHQRQEQMVAEG